MSKDLYEVIVDLRSKGIRAALATIIAQKGATPRKDAAKMLIYEDGRQLGTIGGGSTEAEVCREALRMIPTGKPKLLSFDLTDSSLSSTKALIAYNHGIGAQIIILGLFANGTPVLRLHLPEMPVATSYAWDRPGALTVDDPLAIVTLHPRHDTLLF